MTAGGRCRRLVLVSGAPGAGKTTLAVPLAAELDMALLTKDGIKETLHDALTHGGLPPGALAHGALAHGGLPPGALPPGALAHGGLPPGALAHGGLDAATLGAGTTTHASQVSPSSPSSPSSPVLSARAWSRWLGGAAMELLWALAADIPAVVLEANFRPHSAYERDRIMSLGAAVVEVNCACPPGLAARRYAARAATRHPVHVVDRLTPDMLAQYDQPLGIGQLISVDTSAPVDVAGLASAVRALASPVAGGPAPAQPGGATAPRGV